MALDESTSSVDLESERAMQHALATAFGDATLIIVAHRISTILDCDRVVVMGNGRILEVGPPQELLRRPDGHFRALAGSLAPELSS